MKLNKSKNASINYLSQIVEIKDFTAHVNPNVNKMKVAHVQGYNIIVGIDESVGKYVYFPTSSTINPALLSFANLYRHSEKNTNPDKTGYFGDNGRVTSIKLQDMPSEGFLLPLEVLLDFITSSTSINFIEDECPVGTEFDEVEHSGKSFWISKKYVPTNNNSTPTVEGRSKHQKSVKKFNRMIDEQFRLHYETVLIKKTPYAIQPSDVISLTSKWHGTSLVTGYILTKHPLTFKEKIAKWLTGEEFNRYEYVYASRTVIKNQYINKGVTSGFYNCDVWKEAMNIIQPHLIKGMQVYAEIVGYLPSGGFIQKGYDYHCVQPTNNEYIYGKNYKIMVYRVTLKNVDGVSHEFSAKEVQQWCKNVGLEPVIEYYYGYARDLYPQLNEDEDWCNNFIECLGNDERFYMEKYSPDCNNKVYHEGVVIKKEDGVPHAWKLKCFAFINKEQAELDSGDGNIEDLA